MFPHYARSVRKCHPRGGTAWKDLLRVRESGPASDNVIRVRNGDERTGLIVKFTSACKHFTSVPIAHAYPLRKDTVSKDSPGIDMKQLLFITVLCVGAGLGVARAADKTFTGEIMDSQCAQMGSHDMMMKGGKRQKREGMRHRLREERRQICALRYSSQTRLSTG